MGEGWVIRLQLFYRAGAVSRANRASFGLREDAKTRFGSRKKASPAVEKLAALKGHGFSRAISGSK
jgi:hypothetical protein